MKKPIVFIVDDNEDFRKSVVWMLAMESLDIREFCDAESVISGLQLETPECLLLDVRMPGLSGLDLHDHIRQKSPQLPVIYMTGHADVPLAVEAMKKGAITLLEKPLDMSSLQHALTTALQWRQAQTLPARDVVSAASTTHERLEFEERLSTLTPREYDVLECLVEGQANKVCAVELGISVRTVELHRSRLLKKLHVRSSAELIRTVLLHRVGV